MMSELFTLKSLLIWDAVQTDAKFLWLIMAPFGGPVVPDVYEKVQQSYGWTLNFGSL